MQLKIRCDGESEKFCKIYWELNKALSAAATILCKRVAVGRWTWKDVVHSTGDYFMAYKSSLFACRTEQSRCRYMHAARNQKEGGGQVRWTCEQIDRWLRADLEKVGSSLLAWCSRRPISRSARSHCSLGPKIGQYVWWIGLKLVKFRYASLSGCFTRMSYTFIKALCQQNYTFCMKRRGERRK